MSTPKMTALLVGLTEQEAGILRGMLTEQGIEVPGDVCTVQNASKAIGQAGIPDLLFLDVQAVAEAMSTLFVDQRITCPVVLIGKPEDNLSVTMRAQGFRFLPRTYDADLLQALVSGAGTRESNGSVHHGSRPGPHYRRRFLVRQGQRWIRVDVAQIAWFRAEGKLCFLRTWDNKRYLVDYTLEELGRMLNPDTFFRVNRSYSVHINAIASVAPYFGGKLVLEMTLQVEGDPVLVSKERASEFKEWLGK
ncbi:MAG: LytTR family DNA-binding domain-containing protein [Saprospiraceae bacterium]|nr:LytTR family DNA-binding domain-containing protein [Saprospiraceae bacterium]